MAIIEINKDNFEQEVLRAQLPVLVDFWAPWCGPCRMMSPIVERISEKFAERLKTVKLNVDEAQEIAAKYNIYSIPTLIIFEEGQEIKRQIGAIPEKELERIIKEVIK